MFKAISRFLACYVVVGVIGLWALPSYKEASDQVNILGHAGCYLNEGPVGVGVACDNFWGSAVAEAFFVLPLLYLHVLALTVAFVNLSWWGLLFLPVAAGMWGHLVYAFFVLVLRDLTSKGIGRVIRADA
ncbi:MAG: hypothetical protein P1U67_06190 [Alcanivoracaceae bacterium]|nr:hypothetical protein [Alcanivoracaceae bacterium]